MNSFENSIDTKPLQEMTSRDWRIYRENHNIVCKGGKAPPPLRYFNDGSLLHPSLLKALKEIMYYDKPTPIQRQAIPIGMQRRDLIGIAETGSGKTCAFGIPLIQYILQLPSSVTTRDKVAEQGPLAIVLAPTRELALQIDGEFQKLLTFCVRPNQILSACIVGGQNMTVQAQKLRDGIHIVVGTPGRINECLELTYMVLNQCSYCVLDEGDRMIDMGFAPQLESILDHMGGSLKSENESEAYEQEKQDLQTLQTLQQQQEENSSTATIELPKHRVTAMFSATMPLEVEQMAKKYLRFPAVISVGDRDSRKNARIEQKVLFLSSPSAKEGALRKLILDPRFMREKVLVFVNEKKHCEGVSRQIERIGRRCVVLHGGKSQEEREKNLQLFKQGGVILVATDVAGRGLDISNIAHVINYDLPGRSIDSYSHRIGRTGRAGKAGLATSLLTDDDEGIMAPLKAYLESTGSVVPDKLARHPACNGGSDNNVIY
ncbi:DEAD-domain-containing protein [Fragilariopsis cylindrus CCMP1102]|uniref:RNA helicase n=1 Tax=Fragilariopsis cylindrus CCMP1102 TaxID=635003 RepID=A0A1E7FI79_9STRA|nr:DEAD-domain-containing protein [Fragilariopsis cylindrus CCMP1102]|eukprot:OEU17881.1 DEAD-domain-containing protein [Fragilariopsis cylindrus CCMP1102]